jgi:hypothetical protein
VTLDGSVLAKTALEPAAKLVAALSAPGQGALHLLRVVKPPTLDIKGMEGDQEYIERLKENALHKAKTYLNSVYYPDCHCYLTTLPHNPGFHPF